MTDIEKMESAINTINKMKALTEMVTTEYTESDKQGYDWKITKLGEAIISKEYVKREEETENDGTDYVRPITYAAGMTVSEGLWYTDGEDVWLAIADGTPESFSDKNYFDIIEV